MNDFQKLLPIMANKYDYILVPVKNIEAFEDIPLPSIAVSTFEGIITLDSKSFVVNNIRLSDEIEKCEHGE